MPKTSLYNMEGAAIGEVELSEELFAAPINTAAMHLVRRAPCWPISARARRAPSPAAEVRGGGRQDLPPEGHRQCPSPWF